jgi:hypothetical protein
MVMSIDHPWNDHMASGIENLVAGRRRTILSDQFDDPATLDDKPALAPFGKHCDRIANPGFHRLYAGFSDPVE